MKQTQHSTQKQHGRAASSSPRKRNLIPCWPGMHNILTFVRFCLYLAVVAWAAIVLGLACNFEKMLVASDLTRFVPLAIFIAAATMLVLTILLLAPIALRHNPVSTLYELASLAFLGVFWLALGVYTATAEMGDVECFADDDETEPIEFSAFTTDIYHSQYRALEGFAIINVFLLFGFLSFMLLQAYIHHRKGYKSVWTTPLPMYPWFGGRRRKDRSASKLPPPVTAKEPKSTPPMSSKPAPPVTAPKPAASKPAVFRSGSVPAPTAPPRAAPVRTQTLPASASAPARSKPTTTTKATPAVAKPAPAPPTSSKPKTYPSQYTRPAAGVPQTKTAPGQSSYQYFVPPKQPAPAAAQPAAKTAQRTTAPQPPPKRR